MTGLYLFGVLGIWLALVAWFSRSLVKKLPKNWRRSVFSALIFLVLFPIPLIDEIVGGIQFRRLCNEKSGIKLDVVNIRGRTAWFSESRRSEIKFWTINVTEAKRIYVDVATQEPLYHYYRLEAKGGWFIRALGISEGDAPMLFPSLCQPSDIEDIESKYGITVISRPN